MKPAEFLRLGKAAELAGLEPEILAGMARRGIVASTRTPGNGKGHRLYRRSDMQALRRSIEAGFELNPPCVF